MCCAPVTVHYLREMKVIHASFYISFFLRIHILLGRERRERVGALASRGRVTSFNADARLMKNMRCICVTSLRTACLPRKLLNLANVTTLVPLNMHLSRTPTLTKKKKKEKSKSTTGKHERLNHLTRY